MKKILLISLLFVSNLYSQNLTLDQIISLRKKSFNDVEEYLTSKNWSFLSGEESSTDEKMGNAIFAYNKQDFGDNAEAFFKFIYDNSEKEELCSHRILMQFSNKLQYNNYLNRIKSLGCKLIKSKIEDGDIIKVYQGATTTFQIKVHVYKDEFETSKTIYYFFITSNLDYMFFYDDEPLRDLIEK